MSYILLSFLSDRTVLCKYFFVFIGMKAATVQLSSFCWSIRVTKLAAELRFHARCYFKSTCTILNLAARLTQPSVIDIEKGLFPKPRRQCPLLVREVNCNRNTTQFVLCDTNAMFLYIQCLTSFSVLTHAKSSQTPLNTVQKLYFIIYSYPKHIYGLNKVKHKTQTLHKRQDK